MREGRRLRQSLHYRHDVPFEFRHRSVMSVGEQKCSRFNNRRGSKKTRPTYSTTQSLSNSTGMRAQRFWYNVGVLR